MFSIRKQRALFSTLHRQLLLCWKRSLVMFSVSLSTVSLIRYFSPVQMKTTNTRVKRGQVQIPFSQSSLSTKPLLQNDTKEWKAVYIIYVWAHVSICITKPQNDTKDPLCLSSSYSIRRFAELFYQLSLCAIRMASHQSKYDDKLYK